MVTIRKQLNNVFRRGGETGGREGRSERRAGSEGGTDGRGDRQVGRKEEG